MVLGRGANRVIITSTVFTHRCSFHKHPTRPRTTLRFSSVSSTYQDWESTEESSPVSSLPFLPSLDPMHHPSLYPTPSPSIQASLNSD